MRKILFISLMVVSINSYAGTVIPSLTDLFTVLVGDHLKRGFENGIPITGAGVIESVLPPIVDDTGPKFQYKIIISYVSPTTGVLVSEKHKIKYHKAYGLFTCFTIQGIVNNNTTGGGFLISWKRITNIVPDTDEELNYEKKFVKKLPKSFKVLGNKTLH